MPKSPISDHLGPLEKKIMDLLWRRDDATVRWVVDRLRKKEDVAYTTVMTVMSRLVEKGVLRRESAGRAYVYRPARTKEEFLEDKARTQVRALVNDFGDMALAHFADEIENADPERMKRLAQFLEQRKKR